MAKLKKKYQYMLHTFGNCNKKQSKKQTRVNFSKLEKYFSNSKCIANIIKMVKLTKKEKF